MMGQEEWEVGTKRTSWMRWPEDISERSNLNFSCLDEFGVGIAIDFWDRCLFRFDDVLFCNITKSFLMPITKA